MILRRSLNKFAEAPLVNRDLLPLDFLRNGEWAEVAEVAGEANMVCRMAELGVRVGCKLQMLQGGCPCLLQVEGCRLSLRGEKLPLILVRPVA